MSYFVLFEDVFVQVQYSVCEGVGIGEVEVDDLMFEVVDVDEDWGFFRVDGFVDVYFDYDVVGDEFGDEI